MFRYHEAVRILLELHDPWDLARTILDLGDAEKQQGKAAPARQSHEEARKLDRQTPSSVARPELDRAFARLNLATGRAEDAASLAGSALRTFTAAGIEGDRLQSAAQSRIARSLLEAANKLAWQRNSRGMR